jgi:Amt family ammonium transporter
MFLMKYCIALVLSCCLLPGFAQAAAVAPSSGDNSWMMVSSALVLLMTLPGLALFYGGLVRVRNVLSVLVQCFAIACVVSLLWLICGYSLAFGDGGVANSVIGGFQYLFLGGLAGTTVQGLPGPLFVLYEMTFAIITPALVVGAFAERMHFTAMLIFSILWTLLVYVPVCHWIWGGGWLAALGAHDFAGGMVVHITAGIASLVAALKLGARKGFLSQPMMPHNLTMTLTGAGLLWVGWFGFNGGSALAANDQAASALLATHMAAASGAFAWMLMEWCKYGKASALGVATGMVAGLGTITPAAGYVSPVAACIIGLIAGVVCYYMVRLVKHHWRVDDALDVFPVHGVGGTLGSLLVAVFAAPSLGIFSGNSLGLTHYAILSQLWIQLVAIVVVILWTAFLSWGLLWVIGRFTPLRVNGDEEAQGLDISLHDERGYDW